METIIETTLSFLSKFKIMSIAEMIDVKYRKPNEGTIRLAVVAIEETRNWQDEIQAKAKGAIFGIYLLDLTDKTTLEFDGRFIQNYFSDISTWKDENGEWLDSVDELTTLERTEGEDVWFNKHAAFNVVKEIRLSNKEYRKELADHDYDHNKWLESYVEYYLGNTPL
jgi:outer membrane receptor for ferric coprogen and ferric-rhodotorulic acid